MHGLVEDGPKVERINLFVGRPLVGRSSGPVGQLLQVTRAKRACMKKGMCVRGVLCLHRGGGAHGVSHVVHPLAAKGPEGMGSINGEQPSPNCHFLPFGEGKKPRYSDDMV